MTETAVSPCPTANRFEAFKANILDLIDKRIAQSLLDELPSPLPAQDPEPLLLAIREITNAVVSLVSEARLAKTELGRIARSLHAIEKAANRPKRSHKKKPTPDTQANPATIEDLDLSIRLRNVLECVLPIDARGQSFKELPVSSLYPFTLKYLFTRRNFGQASAKEWKAKVVPHLPATHEDRKHTQP